MHLNPHQKVALVLMNLPPAETAQVWEELTGEERKFYSQVYAELPAMNQDVFQRVLREIMQAA